MRQRNLEKTNCIEHNPHCPNNILNNTFPIQQNHNKHDKNNRDQHHDPA